MDDDLQHPPEEIPKLIEFLNKNEDCDVVMGVPNQKRHPWPRGFGSQVAMRIIGVSVGMPEGVKLSSFRLMRRPVVSSILNFRGHSFTLGSLICVIQLAESATLWLNMLNENMVNLTTLL